MVSKVLFVTFFVVGVAWGYSGGAPEDVCEDMLPKHPVDPQKSAFPYKVLVDKSAVKAGDKVKITISGGKPFKGYLLQVRDGDKAVGTFHVDGADKYSKTINCFGKKQVFQNPIEKQVNHLMNQFLNMMNSMLSRLFPIDLTSMFYMGEVTKNTVTHKNSVEKESVVLDWVAPSGKKTYTVYATVAENGGVFWVRKPTATINVE